jgi:replicative DNA helicase
MTTNIAVNDAAKDNLKGPTNLAAERVVLAGLCQFGGKVITECNEILNIECFTHEANPFIFKTVHSILGESSGVDIPSLVAKASAFGYNFASNKDTMDYIKSLFSFGVKEDNVLKNAKVLRKLDVARKAQYKCRDIFRSLSSITGEENFSEIVSKIEQPIFDFTMSINTDNGDKTELIGEGVDDYLQHIIDNPTANTGIPSVFPIYDKAIGRGRRRGGVYLIGARPKVGKSTIAVNDGLHVAKLGIPVLYLDTEMSKLGQWPRVLANLASVAMEEVETGAFAKNDFTHTAIMTAKEKLKTLPFYYRRIAGKPFSEILSIIRNWVVKDVGTSDGRTNNCLIIYDYFKMMDSAALENMQEYQAMGFQIQQLTDFCGKYDVPCSAFVQINREGITKDTSDILSQSDRLLWLCASVAFLKRKTNEEILEDGRDNGNMKLIVTPEQRFGPGLDDDDWINLRFDKDKCQLQELCRKYEMKKSDTFEEETATDNDDEDEDGEAEF